MTILLSLTLVAIVAIVTIPVAVLGIEIAAGALTSRHATASPEMRPANVAVIIPAHNESSGLLQTVADVRAQMQQGDQLLVVADNCTDDTAAVARAAGAEVIERHDYAHRGKGFALQAAVAHLASDPPSVVIMVDADCRISEGSLARLAAACSATGRPVQALDLMLASPSSPLNQQVAEFAWRVKNHLRPLGLSALGLPCQLMGTGMAFPWGVIHAAELASGEIVEDLKLGLELATKGYPPLFCPAALVTSEFPSGAAGAESQRRRWEGGHLRLIARLALPTARTALARRDLGLLALALDLAVPPLVLLGALAMATFIITGVASLAGFGRTAFAISAVTLVTFVLALLVAWLTHGRDVLPAKALLRLLSFVAGKFALYRLLLKRGTDPGWVRTDRKNRS